ncbi:reactive intermediate/imine deaminase [Paenibacillus agaridevorans]|uniref:Reactive intermediate/imine deaminase n=1 Tax=Paenibacillus agaridevorans TaxID=171404 RepID=A0A2R5EXI9_9BACL|nr:RidA family protein [Paenibacillus agaridevorans]GBG08533.1 reactive intermediate/imine deaminase [Paenibacillus agaridevorans]
MNIKRQSYGTEEIPFSPFSESDSHLFVSGQGGNDPLTGEIKIGDLESQTINTVKNIEIILGQRGLTLKDVVKVNIFLTNRQHYEQFNQIYSLLFSRPYPARTLVYCDLNFDLLVEIDVIAKLKPYEKM